MDQQREVLIWFINFLHWAKVNDYTDPQLHGKDPLVYLLWLASTLLLAEVALKQCTDLVARGLRSRCNCKCAMPQSYKRIIDKENESVQLNNLL